MDQGTGDQGGTTNDPNAPQPMGGGMPPMGGGSEPAAPVEGGTETPPQPQPTDAPPAPAEETPEGSTGGTPGM